jgi:cation diffusion facilitator CzcD-associated flavoprotein CzcO
VEQYLNKVVDYLGIRKDIQLNTKVTAASRDESSNIWRVTTAQGEEYTCRFLVSATGPLATPIKPPYPGLESFKGEWYQTGLWPKDKVQFTGKRVAIIGTGATGVQLLPVIAHTAKHVTVFQRTPNYVIPGRNHTLIDEQMDEIKANYQDVFTRARSQVYGFDITDATLKIDDLGSDAEIQQVLEAGWEKGGFRYIFETFSDVVLSPKSNEAVSEFVRRKIRAIVKDKEVADLLCPHYPIVSKRPPVGHFYYEAFNRDNVNLVDIKSDPIQEITSAGLRTSGREFEFDMIIFAIGESLP